jgi:hypothetical protein
MTLRITALDMKCYYAMNQVHHSKLWLGAITISITTFSIVTIKPSVIMLLSFMLRGTIKFIMMNIVVPIVIMLNVVA